MGQGHAQIRRVRICISRRGEGGLVAIALLIHFFSMIRHPIHLHQTSLSFVTDESGSSVGPRRSSINYRTRVTECSRETSSPPGTA